MEKGGIPVEKFIQYLSQENRSFDDELADVFAFFDYDKKHCLNKHKIKIIGKELSKNPSLFSAR